MKPVRMLPAEPRHSDKTATLRTERRRSTARRHNDMEAIRGFNPYSLRQAAEGEDLIKKDAWHDMSPDEEDLICRLHRLVGDRWGLISGRLPNRNAEEVEKYWKMRKQMQQSKVIKPVCVRAKPGWKLFDVHP